jgi:shikimate dehydrogenase
MPDMKRFAVMGNPVSHSLSPYIHQRFAEQFGISLSYQAIAVEAGDFTRAVQRFAAQGGSGLNVTVPYKLEAWQIASSLSPRAELAGAVNTLRFDDDGSLYGDNTDGVGLVTDIRVNLAKPVAGARLLVIGAGGAVRGVIGPLLEAGPVQLHIANRTAQKAEELVRLFSTHGSCSASGLGDIPIEPAYDIVINGTAASLHGDMPDLPDGLFATGGLAYDMMYASQPTPFMRWAAAQGATHITDGLGMLVEQAAESFYLWHGVRPATAAVIGEMRARLSSDK